MRLLLDDTRDVGHYTLTWDGLNDARGHVSSGVYFLTMRSGHFVATRKMA